VLDGLTGPFVTVLKTTAALADAAIKAINITIIRENNLVFICQSPFKKAISLKKFRFIID
jgi:hypothetical protein